MCFSANTFLHSVACLLIFLTSWIVFCFAFYPPRKEFEFSGGNSDRQVTGSGKTWYTSWGRGGLGHKTTYRTKERVWHIEISNENFWSNFTITCQCNHYIYIFFRIFSRKILALESFCFILLRNLKRWLLKP